MPVLLPESYRITFGPASAPLDSPAWGPWRMARLLPATSYEITYEIYHAYIITWSAAIVKSENGGYARIA